MNRKNEFDALKAALNQPFPELEDVLHRAYKRKRKRTPRVKAWGSLFALSQTIRARGERRARFGMRVKTPPVASLEQASLNAERTKNHLAANIRTSLNAEQRTAEQKENEQRTYQPPTDYQLTTD